MMKVSNRGCIRRLSFRALLANRTRNLVAVLAIALTAVLFTSLFTIALSINEGVQQNNFRQAGGWSNGSFKYLTEEQFEELKDDPLIDQWGLRRFLGMPTEVKQYGTVMVVGGGVGIAAIYPIIKALKEAGNRVITILGARTAELVLLQEECRRYSDELIITTDDG